MASDNLNPLSGDSPMSDQENLQREVRTLRLALQISLVSLLIMSGSIGIYLFRQVSLLRRQVDSSTRAANQLVQHFNTQIAPQGQVFEKKLQEYALNHPDFRARIARYFGSPTPADAAAPTPAEGLPAAPSPSPNP